MDKSQQDFEAWKKEVDDRLKSEVGLISDELIDQPYYLWFERGLTPASAAETTLLDNYLSI